MPPSDYTVRAVCCDHRSSDEETYEALKRATAPLTKAWDKLERAKRITIKFNQAFEPDRLRFHEGQLQELVDYKVARATLRLLRERTKADIQCVEISTMARHEKRFPVMPTITLKSVLDEFDVPFVNGDVPPLKTYKVPGGGAMFDRYLLHESVVETDAFVSVQKMKNHKFMGVTLTLKNLFGLPPQEPHGRSRAYFHHFIRLPYVLVDLGKLANPTLNIIDALVGQSKSEWNGEGRTCDALVAGDHPIATDACGIHLMGKPATIDWPEQFFVRDRSAICIGAERGYGTNDLSRIDFQSEVHAPVARFSTAETDSDETIVSWRKTTCEQALYYRDNMRKFVDKYAGEYILLQQGEVRWHGANAEFTRSRRELAGDHPEQAMYLKLVDPDEAEGEHFEVYEQTLKKMKELGY